MVNVASGRRYLYSPVHTQHRCGCAGRGADDVIMRGATWCMACVCMMRVCMVRRGGCAVDDAWRTCADDVWHVYVRCDVTDDVWFSACVV